MRVLRTYAPDIAGGVVVEAALLLPIILGIGLGTVDASNMLLQNHKLENQLALAASYLAKSADPSSKETIAKRLAVTGTLDGSGQKIIKDWQVLDVSITYIQTANSGGDQNGTLYNGGENIQTIEISSAVEYKGFGILSSIMPNGVNLQASVQERVLGVGS